MKQFKEIQSRLQSLINVEARRKANLLHYSDYVGIDSIMKLMDTQDIIKNAVNKASYHAAAGMLCVGIPESVDDISRDATKRSVFDGIVKNELLIVTKTIEILGTEIKLIEDYD